MINSTFDEEYEVSNGVGYYAQVSEDGSITINGGLEFLVQSADGAHGIQIEDLMDIKTDEFRESLINFINKSRIGYLNLFEFGHGNVDEDIFLDEYENIDDVIDFIYNTCVEYLCENEN